MSKEKEQLSLLEKLGRKDATAFVLPIIVMVFGLLAAITAIFLSIGISKLGFIPGLILSPIFVITLVLFFVSYPSPRYLKKIKKLAFENNEKKLIEIASKINQKSIIALYALFDIQSSEAKTILKLYLDNSQTRKLAERIIGELASLDLEIKIVNKDSLNTLRSSNSIIPIDMVYFIKSTSELGKCMISKMQLTLNFEVVICPYCSNMAKKELLDEWLKEKNTCPVCLTQMTIDDCPIVDVRDS